MFTHRFLYTEGVSPFLFDRKMALVPVLRDAGEFDICKQCADVFEAAERSKRREHWAKLPSLLGGRQTIGLA